MIATVEKDGVAEDAGTSIAAPKSLETQHRVRPWRRTVNRDAEDSGDGAGDD
jgi:hypothetical protein